MKMQKQVLVLLLLCLLPLSHPAAAAPNDKKGLGISLRDAQWQAKVIAVHAHWFYTWGGNEPSNMPPGVTFVPMDWGYYGNKNNSLVEWLAKVKAQPGVHDLLGFNEPDGKKQANLTVQAALEGWPYLMQTDLPLGSPAAVHPDGPWMQQFMQQADALHYRVDFVTIHWYGGNDPKGFLGMLQRVHHLYHRPLWVTEFAVADWHAGPGHPNQFTPAQIASFVKIVLPAMNKMPYVQRYAWFSAAPSDAHLGTSALFNDNETLTALGKLYASL